MSDHSNTKLYEIVETPNTVEAAGAKKYSTSLSIAIFTFLLIAFQFTH